MSYCIKCRNYVNLSEKNTCENCGFNRIAYPEIDEIPDYWTPRVGNGIQTCADAYTHKRLSVSLILYESNCNRSRNPKAHKDCRVMAIESPNHLPESRLHIDFSKVSDYDSATSWLRDKMTSIDRQYNSREIDWMKSVVPEDKKDDIKSEPTEDDPSLYCPDCQAYLPHYSGYHPKSWLHNHVAYIVECGGEHPDTDVEMQEYSKNFYEVSGYCPHCEEAIGSAQSTISHFESEHKYSNSEAYRMMERVT